MKSIFKFIVEPIRYIGSRGFAEMVVKFFDRHEWLIYVGDWYDELYTTPNLWTNY